jgi:hypothetical protein
MDNLSKLFGSSSKVKLMRLFLFNPGTFFEAAEAGRRVGARHDSARKVLISLEKAGIVKKKTLSQPIKNKKTSKGKKTKKVSGWVLDESSALIQPLRALLLPTDALSDSHIEKKFRKTGKLKLLVISGAFLNNDETRIDIMVVADNVKNNALSSTMKDMEAHIGKELRYTVLGTDEFIYRMNIRDKLVRDVFECPHRVVLDKIGIVS